MANERRIRLIQVAKEFNVGINTITDFLQKKGVKSVCFRHPPRYLNLPAQILPQRSQIPEGFRYLHRLQEYFAFAIQPGILIFQ